MKKFVKILTACAALSLLSSCDFFKKPEQPADEGEDTPAVVDVAVTGVSLNKQETNIYFGAKERLTATVTPENATNKLLSWSSSNEDVAVVNATGLVAALGVGDATIRVASQADPTKYDECVVHVTVEDTTVHVSSVTITEESFALDLGGITTAHPHVTVLPANADNKALTWSSSDPSKVLVDSATGTIAALAVTGSTPVVVTATSVDDPTKSDTVSVTVVDTSDHDVHVSGISLPSERTLDLKDGDTIILTAEVTPSNAGNKNIEWTASEENVVSFTPFGSNSVTVRALATGTVTITGTSVDNPAATASCTLTITDTTVYATGISIKVGGAVATEANVELNKNITIDAVITPEGAKEKDVVWEINSEDEQYVTLSSKEAASIIVIGKKATTSPVTLTAKVKDKPILSSTIQVSVIDPTEGAQFISFNDPVDYASYKLRIEEDNLNSVANVATNDSIAKGNFFEFESADDAIYKVGDQGTFRFAPSGNVLLKGDSTPTIIQNIETTCKLYKKVGSEYSLVEFNDYATRDVNGIDYTFKQSALNEEFRLELQPSSKYYSKTVKTYEFEFKVIKGYNVDSLPELSLFDNIQSAWDAYKTEKGLGGVVAEGGIVLHKDIFVVSDNLPSKFVESAEDLAKFKAEESNEYDYWCTLFDSAAEADEQFIGSLKDCEAILNRDTRLGDFNFEGNFFSIDCSTLKTVANLSGGFTGDGSHTSLFNINNIDMCDEAVAPTPEQINDIYMRNFSVKANGGLVTLPDDSISQFELGGLIAFKMDAARVHVENAIVSSAFTAFMMFDDADMKKTEFEGNRIIGFDSYNSVFYMHGTSANTLENSWISKAGGPLVLLDENDSDHKKTHWEAALDAENCYMHNYVQGTEPWFKGHDATSLVQQYLIQPGMPISHLPTDPSEEAQADLAAHWYYALSAGYAAATSQQTNTISKQISGEFHCDFVAVDVNARHFGDNVEQNLTGHFTLNNGDASHNIDMDMSDVAKTITGVYPSQEASCAYPNWANIWDVYIVSSANGGSVRSNYDAKTATADDYSNFVSDYVTIYLNPSVQGGAAGANYGRYISIILGTFPLA